MTVKDWYIRDGNEDLLGIDSCVKFYVNSLWQRCKGGEEFQIVE